MSEQSSSPRKRVVRQIETTRQPFVLDKLALGRIGSVVGSAALVVGILAFIFQGDVTPVVVFCTLLTIAGLGSWMALAPDDLRALVTGRQTIYGSNSVFLSILLIGVVTIVYTLATGTGVYADLTEKGFYTLKKDIQPIITNLRRPIQITAFYSTALLTAQSNDRPILRLYEDADPTKVKVVTVDPNEQPNLARSFGLNSDYGIFTSFLGTDGKPDLNATEQVQIPEGVPVNERWIAEAILRLQARGQFVAVFTVGNGEMTTDQPRTNDASTIRTSLESFNIATKTVDLAQQDIPVGTSVVIMIAPQRDLTQPMVDRIAAYMANGGKLLLMAEPGFTSQYVFMQTDASPMATYLREVWGITPQRDIVFDPVSNNETAYYVLPAVYADNPILNRDASGTKIQPRLGITQSFTVEARADIASSVLYATSEQAFGKKNLLEIARNPERATFQTGDIVGPLALMINAENTKTQAKLIVMGDSDWLRNDLIGNFDGDVLFTNIFDYLTSFVQRVSVNPVRGQIPLSTTSQNLDIAKVVTLFITPGLILLLAGLAWFDRVRRG